MRKHYLDNIRWVTVMLVVVYHVFYLFNAAGVPGGIGSFSETQYQDVLLYFVYPWFMLLLFALAGISARLALEKKSLRAFVRGRTAKLLVPATLGLLVFQWLVGYINVRVGGGLEYMQGLPAPILYLIFVVSGIGPLWFAQMLWLFSLLLALIRWLDKADRLYALCGRAHPLVLAPMLLLIWGGAQLGNVPVLTMYRFGIYGTAFFIGYFILSQEHIQAALQRVHIPLLAAALIMAVIFVLRRFGTDYTSGACLRAFFTNLYAWTAVLAVLGGFRAHADKVGPVSRYMSGASYGVYVLHYFFALVSCLALRDCTTLPTALIYILAVILSFIGSFACFELFRRIPFIRFAVLGIKKQS